MRHKANKLEKGKWYADMQFSDILVTFLKYSHSKEGLDFFSELKGCDGYVISNDGFIKFISGVIDRYIPTHKDIEKHNLNETE